VRGASLVVWGIRDGRDAASGIHDYLTRLASDQEPEALRLAS
jgi:glutamate synthase (NADPH/NADH) small chain